MAAAEDLFGGDLPPEFETAQSRYGIWPVTVWPVSAADKATRRLKQLIGDDGTARGGTGKSYSDTNICRMQGGYQSIFNPGVASFILNLYRPKPPALVYDPFAGGGARAIMCAAAGLSYVGVDIRSGEVQAANDRIARAGYASEAEVLHRDARSVPEIPDGEADFLLTCPPYYNLEKYHGGDADLSMVPTYADFCAGMSDAVAEAARILAPGAIAVWVIGLHRDRTGKLLPLHHDLTAMCERHGLHYREEIILHHMHNGAVQRVGTFEKGRRLLVRLHEYVCVYQKGGIQ